MRPLKMRYKSLPSFSCLLTTNLYFSYILYMFNKFIIKVNLLMFWLFELVIIMSISHSLEEEEEEEAEIEEEYVNFVLIV